MRNKLQIQAEGGRFILAGTVNCALWGLRMEVFGCERLKHDNRKSVRKKGEKKFLISGFHQTEVCWQLEVMIIILIYTQYQISHVCVLAKGIQVM